MPLTVPQGEQRADLVRQMFDRVCGRYDLNNALLSFGLDGYWRWRAKNLLALPDDARVVDLCCGTGAVTRTLAQAVPRGKVVGVDFSAGMLERARAAGCKPGSCSVTYIQADVLNVPLQDGLFDAATLCYGPRNIVDLQALWAEMARLVRPGGQILTLELTRPGGFLGVLHTWYLQVVVPMLGGLVSGDMAAYRYLSKTISGFIEPEELASSMLEGGLREVTIHPLTGGIVTVHLARVG